MESVRKEQERANKRQRLSGLSTLSALDDLMDTIREYALLVQKEKQLQEAATMEEPPMTFKEFKKQVKAKSAKVSAEHKEIFQPLGKFGKAIDKAFTTNLTKITNPSAFKDKTEHTNSLVAKHLLQEGKFAIAETFVREADLQLDTSQEQGFADMHGIVASLKEHNLEPALRWAKEHSEQLAGVNSALEFKLHRMAFIELLRVGKKLEAIRYANNHFDAFADSQIQEIKKLMGALVFIDRLEKTQYAEYLAPNQWSQICRLFTQDCCKVMGVSKSSSLEILLDTGCMATPKLLRGASVLQNTMKSSMWTSLSELPVEIDVGTDRTYHSVFACPVSREQSSPKNPPVRLSCGHVICRESATKLARGTRFRFKCTYCSTEQILSEVVEVKF
eukprot:m.63043 g.63043  ORF g.63043 m.63043 type:complete len:389 (-) comp19420_c0_seq1:45-1211(-)